MISRGRLMSAMLAANIAMATVAQPAKPTPPAPEPDDKPNPKRKPLPEDKKAGKRKEEPARPITPQDYRKSSSAARHPNVPSLKAVQKLQQRGGLKGGKGRMFRPR